MMFPILLQLKGYLLTLMYPGLILIDYGHFQYPLNLTSL